MALALTRRTALLAMAASLLLVACAIRPPPADLTPPIVFVHGNGDSAALWVRRSGDSKATAGRASG